MQEPLLKEVKVWAKKELDRCVDFWLEYGLDKQNGGVYTCLDQSGTLYSTDKSVWMQGRCGWTFSRLCNQYGSRPVWLEAAKSCLVFLENHCINHDYGGRLYFTVTGDGRPLRQRRYFFSEAFYILANIEYYGATGDRICLERARKYYDFLYELNTGSIADPVGLPSKSARSDRALANPMIYLNVTSVMRLYDKQNQSLYDTRARECANEIVKYHLKPELGCTLETVALDGSPMLDISSGRVVNPGHCIECSWFLAEQALHSGDQALLSQAQEVYSYALNAGWDKEYGGLLSFVDCKGYPPEAYEHDMKLWWPHNEMMIASLMFYKETGKEEYWQQFEQVRQYAIRHFCDPAYGEWYGYLRRDGKPTEPACKGSTFKGPFHVMRCMMAIDKLLDV